MEDFFPIGNSWQQDIAYHVRQLKNDFDNTDFCCNSGSTIIQDANIITGDTNVIQGDLNVYSGTVIEEATIVTGETIYTGLTINITQIIHQQPDTVFVSNPLPIMLPVPGIDVSYNQIYVKPDPIIIDVERKKAYARVCGDAYSSSSNYIDCYRCVDKWLDARPDGFELKDLTSSGTGCSTNKPKPIDCGCCRNKKKGISPFYFNLNYHNLFVY